MHYYEHNIGDYRRDTAHLSLLEHGIYRQLLDTYYLSEQPIPRETQQVFRRLCAITEEEQKAVILVLNDFFTATEDGWIHKRCDAMIDAYHQKANTSRSNGKLGGRPKKTQQVILGSETETQAKANITLTKEPLTNNLDKEKIEKKKSATRLPQDWQPSDEDVQFCRTERSDLDPYKTGERFRDYWLGVSGAKGRKLDWPATWRNWVRNEKRQMVNGFESQKDRERREWNEKMFGKKQGVNDGCIDSTAQRLD